MSDIEAIKARLAAATPGPWTELAESGEWWIGRDCEEPEQFGMWICDSASMSDENIEFIAHAPTDIAALLDELARMVAALREIDRTPVGAYEVGSGSMPEPCEQCGEMRDIAARALGR